VGIAGERRDAPTLDDWLDFDGCWFDHVVLKKNHSYQLGGKHTHANIEPA
jgi:hypothetical protein